jgi:branched-chain amino acid transport system substrate-binding protein
MKKILIVPIALILTVSFVLVGCSSSTSTPPIAGAQTLNIGEIESTTGMFSDFMKYVPQGAKIAADLVNSKGGITINGQKYNINLILEDNKSSPDGAAAAANDLILNKNVKFITGTGVTPLVIAIDQVTEPAGILYAGIYQNGTPDEMGTTHPLKFVGSNCSFSAQLTTMEYLKQAYPQVKTVAFTQSDDGQIKYDDPVIRANATKLGLTIQGDIIGIAPSVTDYTPYAQKAVASKADAIMIGNAPTGEVGQLIQLIRGLGFTGPICDGSWAVMPDVLSIAGTAAEGFFGNSLPADPNISSLPAITKQVVQTSITNYGTFNSLDVQGFNSVYTLAQAIQNAQSLDPKVVATAWGKMTNIDTIFGPGTMGGLQTYGVNHNVYFQTPIEVIKNGQLQLATWIPLNQSTMP